MENHEQGTIEWHLDRMGCVSASQFHKVLGSAAVRRTYFNELTEAREALSQGRDYAKAWLESRAFDSPAMAWGRKHEDAARAAYELAFDEDVQELGFTRLPGHPDIGASLDGEVSRGTIEIKCPYNLENHIRTCEYGMPAHHLPQVQGGLWIRDKNWCDFISFHPGYGERRLYVERIERDSEYVFMLAKRVTEFAEALAKGQELPEYNQPDTEAVPALF